MPERIVADKMIEFGEDGFMNDPGQWDKAVAEALASEIGISPLTEKHWFVIEFCRSDFAVKGDAPTLRRITKEANVPTKELYTLFPKGPAKKVAYIAGLKKPSGCI